MSRTALIVLVGLSAYCLLDLAISLVVAIVWRTRAVAPANLPPAVRARRLLQLRLLPGVAGPGDHATRRRAGLSPASSRSSTGEPIGPVLALLASLSLLQLSVAAITAARSVWLTRRVEREWLRGASAIDARQSAGLHAFAVQSPSPIVAMVGVFNPKLIASELRHSMSAPRKRLPASPVTNAATSRRATT
jgi:hypothetical protein